MAIITVIDPDFMTIITVNFVLGMAIITVIDPDYYRHGDYYDHRRGFHDDYYRHICFCMTTITVIQLEGMALPVSHTAR